MKIAISGKGGVGKTLLAASLAKTFADSGYSVLAIDADSNSNLGATLGVPQADKIVPISEMKDLVEERTGARPGKTELYFKINPKVDDLPEKFWREHNGVKLMVMGQVKRGGSGCYCPENVLLQALVTHLLLGRKEVIIMDMEAGIEHLGRATASAVDKLVIVVEPGRIALDTALRIKNLAKDINITNIGVVGNKIHSDAEKKAIASWLPGFEILGFLPYDYSIEEAELSRQPTLDASLKIQAAVKEIYKALLAGIETSNAETR
jgi:CO dehydrogenase maturation factor